MEITLSPETIAMIRRFTMKRWGAEQDTAYYESLRGALYLLCSQPMLGRLRQDLRPGIRTHHVMRHTFHCATEGESLVVLRILHERMDLIPETLA